MEAEARDILREGTRRRRRWLHATLADLSGPRELADLETPFVRSDDPPRDVEW
jgi:plasmid stability protein